MTTPDSPARFVYTGRTTNWLALGLGLVLLVPLFVGAKEGLAFTIGWTLFFLTVLLGAGSSLRTTAGPIGMTVHFGVVGWPRFRYPIERIATAEPVVVGGHWSWGPWWTHTGGLQLALGPGGAVRLTLTNGRKVTIGTPDPAAAIAALGLEPK